MTWSRLPVLWFCGAPGTGKSTVAWQVLLDLDREGIRAGYVDIDQLGMVNPPPSGDGDRAALKAANVEAVVANYARAGASALVVSGVIDPEQIRRFSGTHEGFEVTFCQLTAAEPVLRQRLTARGWSTVDGDRAVGEMRALQSANLIGTTLDTTTGSQAELAARGRRLVDPAPGRAVHTGVRLAVARGAITVVCGPRAVGKSSVSWAMFTHRTATGLRTAYLDLDQISVLRGGGTTDPDRRVLRNANLAAVWRTAVERGATALIANGMLTDDQDIVGLRDAVHPAEVHVIRLSAAPAAIEGRIRRRHCGSPARLIGDDLDGASPDHQRRILQDALDQERRLSRTVFPDQVIDTTAMTLDDVVHRARTPPGSEAPGRDVGIGP